MAEDCMGLLVHHLEKIGKVPRISLFLYTRGGQTLAAWSIASLLSQFCDEFEVIIPDKAHSAGTLLSLGAKTILMTSQASLGPIDPTVNTPLNPQIPGAPPAQRFPVSVEAINGFLELAKNMGISGSTDLMAVLSTLTSHVHPLVLGQVVRTRGQIRMLASRLLQKHMSDQERIEKILSFLCSESGSHDYRVYRKEARDELGLNVEFVADGLNQLILKSFGDMADELKLAEPFAPLMFLGQQTQSAYVFRRVILESVAGGSHGYFSEGSLTRRQFQMQPGGPPQVGVDDNRTFEGWRHDSK